MNPRGRAVWLVLIGLLLVSGCAFTVWWTDVGMSKCTADANWMAACGSVAQAVLTVVALACAIAIPALQHHADSSRRRKQGLLKFRARILDLVPQIEEIVSTLNERLLAINEMDVSDHASVVELVEGFSRASLPPIRARLLAENAHEYPDGGTGAQDAFHLLREAPARLVRLVRLGEHDQYKTTKSQCAKTVEMYEDQLRMFRVFLEKSVTK